jgi:hypothetical protein
MALMKVKGGLERLFDKNLSDLVRGIRNHKDDEAKYIAICLEEIKQVREQTMPQACYETAIANWFWFLLVCWISYAVCYNK